MAAKASTSANHTSLRRQPSNKETDKKRKRKTIRQSAKEEDSAEYMNTLPWNPSIAKDIDPFSHPLSGSTSELDGGFLSLEEIDESQFGLSLPDIQQKIKKKKTKKKKSKKNNNEKVSDVACIKLDSFNSVSQEEKNDARDHFESQSFKTHFYAWDELRLHPLLMKSIYALGFNEPTAIQKACIPAAAHKGKDVIGSAETGSGKTLAFGLPILQRLLEEQEKQTECSSVRNTLEQGVRESPLRALIVVPTRELSPQVAHHLQDVARFTSIKVVDICGGLNIQKQERCLKSRPEIVVGTPGRLLEFMSGQDHHLSKLQWLSFFVLDEADRMVEDGHFPALEKIIQMLPTASGSAQTHKQVSQDCTTVSNLQQKKRQTLVFSATLALSDDFRKKLKRGSHKMKNLSLLESLSKKAGIRDDAAVVDLTTTSIVAGSLEESFIECMDTDKDAYLYYVLSIHGQSRTIVFCTSIPAARRVSSLLRILGINVWTFHSQMRQRERLKAIDRFRGNEHAVLVASDCAARGLDIPGVRTVIHYQLPHSAEVYVHRSGRTARAFADGCCIALISPSDRSKFVNLCKSFSKESYQWFPVDNSYMPEVIKRLSLARQIEKNLRKDSQENATKSWLKRNAESVELVLEDNDSEEERVNSCKQKKRSSLHLKKLQQELNSLLSCPLQPTTLSHRFLAGSGVSPSLQYQFEKISKQKAGKNNLKESNKRKLVVIGKDCIEPLKALRNAKNKGHVNVKENADKQRSLENLKRKRKQEKKGLREKLRMRKKQRN